VELAFHPVQLAAVWAERSSSRRRTIPEDQDLPELTFSGPSVRGIQLVAEGQGFRCDMFVGLTVPVGDHDVFDAALVVRGFFSVDSPISRREVRTFARYQAIFLLWPFARSYFDVLAMQSGVAAPPLPTLIVPEPG
jgi:hypothetical protein